MTRRATPVIGATVQGRAWSFTVPRYLPPRLNELLRKHWSFRCEAQGEADGLVAAYAKAAGVPKATGKRRVSLTFHGGRADPDARLKLLLDALVHAGLLVDDSGQWCEIGEVRNAGRRGDRATVVILEDVE